MSVAPYRMIFIALWMLIACMCFTMGSKEDKIEISAGPIVEQSSCSPKQSECEWEFDTCCPGYQCLGCNSDGKKCKCQ
uniref:SLPTX13 n=1 Tax=Scolopendra viridis TaxID=118503 RepID=A0A4D5R9J3_SCOVI